MLAEKLCGFFIGFDFQPNNVDMSLFGGFLFTVFILFIGSNVPHF